MVADLRPLRQGRCVVLTECREDYAGVLQRAEHTTTVICRVIGLETNGMV